MDLMKANQAQIYYHKCAIEGAFETSKQIFIGVSTISTLVPVLKNSKRHLFCTIGIK